MKLALLGDGKTGHKIIEVLAKQKKEAPTVFNLENPPNLEKLKGHDVIISFLPGPIFTNYIGLLLKSKIPVVTGSTDIAWPKKFHEKLIEENLKWIYASNFALGMRVVHAMIEEISEHLGLFNDYKLSIHEIHHSKKLDAPSGTALSWEKWLKEKIKITSERVGDVAGIHELTLDTGTEVIKVFHEAKDRSIFAQGALFAANELIKNDKIKVGLNAFEDIVRLICK